MAPHLLEWEAWRLIVGAYVVWHWILPALFCAAGPRHRIRPTAPLMKFTEAWWTLSALFHIATVISFLAIWAFIIAAKLPQ